MAPPIMLFQGTSVMRKGKKWFARVLLRQPHFYDAPESIDREVSGVCMVFQTVIVLGFCVPILLPLAFLTMGQSAAGFRFARCRMGLRLTDEVRPSTQYMWFSASLGYALAVWLFCVFRAVGAPPR